MPIEPDPVGLIRRTVANRETNFLNIAQSGIFNNPLNPYQKLFAIAGCWRGPLLWLFIHDSDFDRCERSILVPFCVRYRLGDWGFIRIDKIR
jgi:hypothetical protein